MIDDQNHDNHDVYWKSGLSYENMHGRNCSPTARSSTANSYCPNFQLFSLLTCPWPRIQSTYISCPFEHCGGCGVQKPHTAAEPRIRKLPSSSCVHRVAFAVAHAERDHCDAIRQLPSAHITMCRCSLSSMLWSCFSTVPPTRVKKRAHTHSENNERTSLLIWMRNICLTWCHCNKLNTLPKTTATATTFSHILRAWSVERSCTSTHYVRNIVQRNTERAAACHHSHRQHVRQRANDYLCLSYSLQHWLKLKATTETLNYS